MNRKILFRADGNSETGLGHLYRLFGLVEIIKDTYDFVFLTNETSTDSVIPELYNKQLIPKNIKIEEEPKWLVANFPPEEYIVVADGYQFAHSYQKDLKLKGYLLIYIDDLAKEHMFADEVINHSFYARESHYQKEAFTNLHLGSKYALLRPLFLKQAEQYRLIKTINNVFVCFGGADPFNLSFKAVQALLKISSIKEINVVLGGAYRHLDIFDLEKIYPNRIKIFRNLSEEQLLKGMLNCDFAIAPASTILYELCCTKIPILGGYYVENQKLFYEGLIGKNIIFEGGDFSKYYVSDFEDKIKMVLESSKIGEYLKKQQKLFDGNIRNRLKGIINQLNISLRKCSENDIMRVFKWSNDETVRKNSFNSERILFEDHKSWFLNKITDKNTLFLIALVNSVPAGVIRYEKLESHAIVGLLVSKEFRGQNLAGKFLIESAKLYFKNATSPILAYIKKENIVSIRTFEKAGYLYLKDDKVKESSSFVYILDKSDVKE